MSNNDVIRIDLAIERTIPRLLEEWRSSPVSFCITGSKALEACRLIPHRNTPEMDILVFDPSQEVDLCTVMQDIVDNCKTYGVTTPITFLQTSGGSSGDGATFELLCGSEKMYKIDFLYCEDLMDTVGIYHTPPGIFQGKHRCKTQLGKHWRDFYCAIEILTRAFCNGT